jgi:2,3,4,5-tetrahydropyridine-2,6-dicarboxylate N-succinyltransferase
MSLQTRITDLFERRQSIQDPAEHLPLFQEFIAELDAGRIRAAEPVDGEWRVNTWVKQGILLGFKLGQIVEYRSDYYSFFDKDTFPPKRTTLADGVRIVPGGSLVRTGSYLAPGVVCMPPMYVNVGAYVDANSMIDSHALVGSCAQIGKRVHISAAAQIGGVLEPVGTLPVIIEDDVIVGGNCGVYEGTIVRKRAVLAAGVVLTGSTPVYDLAQGRVIQAKPGVPLEIPENAVVIPGARAVQTEWGKRWGVSIQTPLIVKYRDAQTDAAVNFEELLRPSLSTEKPD